ncbi:uncharacterized protein LOC119173936 [Rhipicephalus microplus]|uniref:uncharacterized protein LOC119173936 n=1 Tax=Rhipicephalus microplus TaxID=6941 RepID=UPI003F6CD7FC
MPKAVCAVFTCPSKSGSGVSLHAFPREGPRRQKWIEFVRACGRVNWDPVQNSRICGLHFEAQCFMPTTLDLADIGRLKKPIAILKSDAVPGIRHVHRKKVVIHRFPTPGQSDTRLPKRPRPETCSDRDNEPDIPVQLSTDHCAVSDNVTTISGCHIANVHTQCDVEEKYTQVSHKHASSSTGVQTRPTISNVGCQTDLELPEILLSEEIRQRTSWPRQEPLLVCSEPFSEPSLTYKDDS